MEYITDHADWDAQNMTIDTHTSDIIHPESVDPDDIVLAEPDLESTVTPSEPKPSMATTLQAPSTAASEIAESARAQPSFAKQLIYVKPGDMAEVIHAMADVLGRLGQFFERSREPVVLRQDRHTHQWQVLDLRLADLLILLSVTTEWKRFKPGTESWALIDPDERLCRRFLEMDQTGYFRPLKGLAHQPHLRPDGSLCSKPGYDDVTGLFGTFDDMPEAATIKPDRDEAQTALRLLESLLDEFAFAGPTDRSAALCAMLTAAVRPSLPQAPLFHIAAHQPGSGKSYLSRLISAFVTPTVNTPVAFPRSQDECDKLLLAQLMRCPAVIEFDNLTTDIKPFDKLCSALTSEQIEGRVLGTSGTVMTTTRVLMLSSGNNVRPVGDMLRRTVVINLDPGVESPATRSFKRPHLVDEVLRDRARFVNAALTVVRAWLQREDGLDIDCKPLNSFHTWSEWCRKPLIWLDRPDPAEGVFKGIDEDPSKQLLARVLNGWQARLGNRSLMVRELIAETTRSTTGDGLFEALLEASGGSDSINSRKLGHWLAQHQGRIAEGLRVTRAPKTRNVESWRVESVVSV